MADTRNKAPVFPDQDTEMEGRQTAQERSVNENTPSGRRYRCPRRLLRTKMSNLTYTLGGPDAASFSIDRKFDGQLSTKADLDKETKDTYTVTVTAADSLNESSTITVTIKVTNVDETAESGRRRSRAITQRTAQARWPPLRQRIRRAQSSSGRWPAMTWTTFMIIENGVLRFKSSPDFEDPKRNAWTTPTEVTVQASDGGAADDSLRRK